MKTRLILATIIFGGVIVSLINAQECESVILRGSYQTVCTTPYFCNSYPFMCIAWNDQACETDTRYQCNFGVSSYGYFTTVDCPGTLIWRDCYRPWGVDCAMGAATVWNCSYLLGSYEKWNLC